MNILKTAMHTGSCVGVKTGQPGLLARRRSFRLDRTTTPEYFNILNGGDYTTVAQWKIDLSIVHKNGAETACARNGVQRLEAERSVEFQPPLKDTLEIPLKYPFKGTDQPL